MAIREISRRELEDLVKARLSDEGVIRSFEIHGLKKPDVNGCNWYLLAETADGWKPLDLIIETAEDVLESIHAELSKSFNLASSRSTR